MTTIHELSDMLEKANKALLSAAQTIEVLGMENQKMREASAKFYANQSPPQRTWVGLTQQDIDIAFDDTQEGGGFDDFARAIEAKLREKNT